MSNKVDITKFEFLDLFHARISLETFKIGPGKPKEKIKKDSVTWAPIFGIHCCYDEMGTFHTNVSQIRHHQIRIP